MDDGTAEGEEFARPSAAAAWLVRPKTFGKTESERLGATEVGRSDMMPSNAFSVN
jgi:hypothetical protein